VEAIYSIVSRANDIVWGPFTLMFLTGTGIFLTFALRFVTLRKLIFSLRMLVSRPSGSDLVGDITPVQALTTELAGTIGTGNIAGVATAIALGGPGAVFWMWICALFGMATKFAEAFLAVKYRRVMSDQSVSGGPMWYLSEGLGVRWLGVLFALLASVACFGIGNMVQSNSVALALYSAWEIPHMATGVVLASLTGLVVIGGIKRIGMVTERLVPLMGVLYVTSSVIIVAINMRAIPHVLQLIFTYAFTPVSAAGGFGGALVSQAIRYGIARGVFSNEAGLGSTPIAHAAAKTDNPVRQGLVAMTGVFFDTLVICSLTAFVILLSEDFWMSGQTSSALSALAYEGALPGFGQYVVIFGLTIFAYSTIIGWAYYGQVCIEFIFGLRARRPYRFLYCFLVLVGASAHVELVWQIADVMNGAMIIPNLIGVVGLSPVVIRETRKYLASRSF
jgi:AGCS family alanine or glycine:cation symporter